MTRITRANWLIRAAFAMVTSIVAIATQPAAVAEQQALLSTNVSAAVMEATDRFSDALHAEIAIAVRPRASLRFADADPSIDKQEAVTRDQVIAANTHGRATDNSSESSRQSANP